MNGGNVEAFKRPCPAGCTGSTLLGLFFDQLTSRAAEQLVNETGRVNAATEVGVLENGLLEGDGGFDAGDHVFTERAAHFVHRLAAVFAVGDELANQRIVRGRYGVTGVRVDTHAYAGRSEEHTSELQSL